MTKTKKGTAENLAGMVSRGFSAVDNKIQRGFEKNEEEHREIVAVLKEMIVDMREMNGNVKETKDLVKGLVGTKNFEERISRLEKKAGIL